MLFIQNFYRTLQGASINYHNCPRATGGESPLHLVIRYPTLNPLNLQHR